MANVTKNSNISYVHENEEIVKRTKYFFGLFTSEEILGSTFMGSDIIINTDGRVRNVIVNGKKYTKSNLKL